MRIAQSRQKSYAARRRRPLEFKVGDEVFHKLSPMKLMFRTGKGHKLSPKYIRPYKIVERMEKVVYRVAIPRELSHCHDLIHVSMLRKYEPESDLGVETTNLIVNNNMTITMQSVQVTERGGRTLRGKTIP
ncbi:hypothetical protein MLD38_035586 [Melastoma candidum]|uniref:Uncharacterized protein n=1 Tax=Melastoma candidum TaxID=119954 RepID=A0ACB9LHK3_9MYRT|nr:hypothetical protein MLD38_035586 [Melastoma candidum]